MSTDLVSVMKQMLDEQVDLRTKELKNKLEEAEDNIKKMEGKFDIIESKVTAIEDTTLVLGNYRFKSQFNRLKELVAEAINRCIGYDETEKVVFRCSLRGMIYGGISRLIGVPNSGSIPMKNYEDEDSDFNKACEYAKCYKLTEEKAREMVSGLKLRVTVNTWRNPRTLECANMLISKPIDNYNLVRCAISKENFI